MSDKYLDGDAEKTDQNFESALSTPLPSQQATPQEVVQGATLQPKESAKSSSHDATAPSPAVSVIVAPAQTDSFVQVGYKDIFQQFILLGWTAFGGPSAHIALFQKIFIEKLNWMSASLFMELFALSQCLPGPSSTQVSFSIGVVKKGILGGLMSGMLFQYPGLIMMALIGWGANSVDWQNDTLQAFASALGAVGVALVAGSAFALSVKTCPDRETRALNLLSTVVAYLYTSWWIFPALIAFGGAVTLIRDRNAPVNEAPGKEGIESLGVGKPAGALLLVAWLAVLVAVITLRNSGYPYEGAGRALYWSPLPPPARPTSRPVACPRPAAGS